jgi:hypothetical protein
MARAIRSTMSPASLFRRFGILALWFAGIDDTAPA